MNKKLILVLILIIISSIFIYGCDVKTEDIIPSSIPLEDSIKEIVLSKGENYDFLHDELFISKVNELGLSNHFTVGNLDDDNIPELVVFVERNPEDKNDQGKLDIYKFSGEKYGIIDSISMNYDNTNYQLAIGKISSTQDGILLSNQVGAHAGVTYGYILENGKLKSILNEKKISLISIYTDNEIKDIDNDGILEFSIYTIDPETQDQSSTGSDKITLWYKWDENDSGELIQFDRISNKNSPNLKSLNAENKQLEISEANFMAYLKEYIAEYDKYEITDLIKNHINTLNLTIDSRSIELDKLFTKYLNGNNNDYLDIKYGLSLDRLNDLEYLKREKILQSEPDLKESLIIHLELGYKVDSSEGMYFYVINNQKFINSFGEFITKEYRDYLSIQAKYTNELFLSDGALIIPRNKLAERIVEIESFRITYPYSNHINEVNDLYKQYVVNFIYGNINTPNLDNTNKFSDGSIAVFQETINKYPHTHFADILNQLIISITPNLNVLTDETKEIIYNLII